jgi:hypothetical protein
MLQVNGVIDLKMDMKYKQFTNPLLDFVVPLASIVVVLSAIHATSRYLRMIKYCGVASLYIMYMHIPLNVALHSKFEFSAHPALFVVIGMTIPTLVYYAVHGIIDSEKFQQSRERIPIFNGI